MSHLKSRTELDTCNSSNAQNPLSDSRAEFIKYRFSKACGDTFSDNFNDSAGCIAILFNFENIIDHFLSFFKVWAVQVIFAVIFLNFLKRHRFHFYPMAF